MITFGGDERTEVLNSLLADLDEHYTRSIAFVVPPGVSWPLPLYELALMTAQHIYAAGFDDVRIDLVTPEMKAMGRAFGREYKPPEAGTYFAWLQDARQADAHSGCPQP